MAKIIPGESSLSHVTGSSRFVDDRAPMKNEVFVGIVPSPVAKGVLLEVDSTLTFKIPGVLDVLTARDLKHNAWGTIVHDQPILVDRQIMHMDEPVALVVADTREAVLNGIQKTKLRIKEEVPCLTLDDSIKKNDFIIRPSPLSKGDVDKVFASDLKTLSGEFFMGGQEHFYLEPQAAIAYPQENGRIEIFSSTQHPTEVQNVVSETLGIDRSKVSVISPRMGGAFGGKESQAAPFAAMVAIAAKKLNRPARLVISQDEDMKMTGKRHPFKAVYQVSFSKDGTIKALKATLYADVGSYTDLSPSIIDRALFHIDGCYFIENVCVEAFGCRTNLTSNTAFRGFGGPQGNLVIETVIEDIARHLGIDSAVVRSRNLYRDGFDTTHYDQKLQGNVLPELFSKLLETSRYLDRKKQISEMNANSAYVKRGIAITGCKFGIAFTARFLNQGSALVHILQDGSTQVSTGATEMGQGVQTKIAQIVAGELGIDIQKIEVMPTSTERNANTSPTAASSGSDINGGAVFKAVSLLRHRLAEVARAMSKGEIVAHGPTDYTNRERSREEQESISKISFLNDHVVGPDGKIIASLKDVIRMAYLNRISLSEHAHYQTPNIGGTNRFGYFTNGAAVAEVEIDVLTGELKVIRSDILMDLGRPINLDIDRGQVIGGFVQGMGWLTTERLKVNEKGSWLTKSATTYKVPNVQDIPRQIHVDFFPNEMNDHIIHKSKAVGEPPLLLSTSVFCAVKNALASWAQNGVLVRLNAPASNEAIVLEAERLRKEGPVQI